MSQIPRFTRARQLTASVWPGRVVDGYGNLIAARLRKLAAARSTGALPFTGRTDGAIYFRDGSVVFAESRRTPGPVVPAGLIPAPPAAARDLPVNGAGPGPAGRLTAMLAVTEPTVDAALELLSSESRYAKFRSARIPVVSPACSIPLEGLLAEIVRRQCVLRQLADFVTADTAVVRNPYMDTRAVKVSALQWALLIRVRDGSTPRALAWELGRSVFGTTTEVYRLMALRLLRPVGDTARPGGRAQAGAGSREQGRAAGADPATAPAAVPVAAMSFIRAVPGLGAAADGFSGQVAAGGRNHSEKGDRMPEDASATAAPWGDD